jgi:hypothetical protein
MTPETIIEEATVDGVQLKLSPSGRIKILGKPSAIEKWRPVIVEQKAELLTLLKPLTCSDRKVECDKQEGISRWWRFVYPNREPKEVSFFPPVTRAEALAGEVHAISAEPFEPSQRRPANLLSIEDEELILQWLSDIDETDEEIIEGVLKRCQTDEDARNGYLRDAKNSNENRRWLR